MQAEKLIKNFVSEVKSEDFDGSSMLEAAYNNALGDFAQSGNSEALLRDVVLISQRSVDANHLTADTINEIGTKQIDIEREMANERWWQSLPQRLVHLFPAYLTLSNVDDFRRSRLDQLHRAAVKE